MFKNLTDNQKLAVVLVLFVVGVFSIGLINTVILAVAIYFLKEFKSIFKWIGIGLAVAFFGGNLLGWLSLPCIIYGIILYGKEQLKKDEERWAKEDAKVAQENSSEEK